MLMNVKLTEEQCEDLVKWLEYISPESMEAVIEAVKEALRSATEYIEIE